jgi:hypothetical protein
MKIALLVVFFGVIITTNSLHSAMARGVRISIDEVAHNFQVYALVTTRGNRVLAQDIIIDGEYPIDNMISARRILLSRHIELVNSGNIIELGQIRYLIGCPKVQRSNRRGGRLSNNRFSTKQIDLQSGDGDQAMKEPHTDGWPCNNNR